MREEMSEIPEEIIIHTGGDPRRWPEFSALREEINKISHPARPEVNWGLAESLALTLFRVNGVDLQTAVYYTLARTRNHGLAGFTEGCELIAALVAGQWEVLWPTQGQARQEMLEWFNSRVGSLLRQQTFRREDLPLVYRAEQALRLLSDKLAQTTLKRVPRIENLLYFMQNTASGLEAAGGNAASSPSAALKMPPLVYLSVPETEACGSPLPASAPQEADADAQSPVRVRLAVPVAEPRFQMAWGFGAGVLLSLLTAVVVYLLYIKPVQQQLAALAATPEGQVQLWLARPDVTTYGQQLRTLENLPPLAGLRTAERSVALARERWPADPVQTAESQRRERLLEARAGNGAGDSYFRLQQQLQTLSETLLRQEKTRGSLTLSYLKTAVYEMQTELNREVPLEELLRRLAVAVDTQQPASLMLMKETDERWNALLSRYYQLARQAEGTR